MGSTSVYGVSGMTGGYSVIAVTQQLKRLRGVRDVTVDLDTTALSTVVVVSDFALDEELVRSAVEAAGYRLDGGTSWEHG